MKSTHLYLLIFIALSLFACKDDEPIERPSIYVGCCDVEPTEFIGGNYSSLFIPNAFTPNGDGVNDLLQVITNNVDFVPRFEIKDQQGEVVFSRINFSAYFEDIIWDGSISHFGNEAIVGGLYTYEMEFFTIYGVNQKVEGSVCVFLCDENFPEDVENCLFTTQFDGYGSFDPSIGTQEGNCFN